MRIKVVIGSSGDELLFFREDGRVYWKSWWRGYLHVIRLMFQGHEVEYDE